MGLRGLILGLRELILGLIRLILGLRGLGGGCTDEWMYKRKDVWKFTSVLQDIGPLGLLPCCHSTTSANHSEQGIGYC